MDYYRRYIGDYRRDTATLSLTEHGAYALMLDEQYATECGLPADPESLYLLCRAITIADQHAVQRIADRFFPIDGDVRRNCRAEQEIVKARAAIDRMRAAGGRGAAKRWGNDGVPHGVPDSLPDGVPHQLRDGNNPWGSDRSTNHQPPSTSNQPPSTIARYPDKPGRRAARAQGDDKKNNGSGTTKRGTRLPDDWRPGIEGMAWAREHGIDPMPQIDAFADYWRARPGAGGIKLDWLATWRNWIRKCEGFRL